MDDLDEDTTNEFLRQGSWGKYGVKMTEATKAPETKVEESTTVTETEEHVCPMCDSVLKEDLSDLHIAERLDVLNEIVSTILSEDSETDETATEETEEEASDVTSQK